MSEVFFFSPSKALIFQLYPFYQQYDLQKKKKLKFSYIRVFQFRFFQIHSRTRLFVFHSIPRWTRFHCRSIEYFIADARDIHRPGQIKAHGNGYELLPRYRLLVQTLIVAGHRIASTCVPAND